MSLFFSLGTKRSLFFALCKLNLTKSAQRYNKNFTYASVRVFFFAKVTILSLDFNISVRGEGGRVTGYRLRVTGDGGGVMGDGGGVTGYG